MNSTNTGGPAFPYGTAYAGMTLRDYFAAKVMQGLMADPNILTPPEGADIDNIYAEQAYIYADAMLKAREA